MYMSGRFIDGCLLHEVQKGPGTCTLFDTNFFIGCPKPCLHQPYGSFAIACEWKRKEFARDRTAVVRIRNAVPSIETLQLGFRHAHFSCDLLAIFEIARLLYEFVRLPYEFVRQP